MGYMGYIGYMDYTGCGRQWAARAVDYMGCGPGLLHDHHVQAKKDLDSFMTTT